MSVATDIQNLRRSYPALAERVYPHRCSISRIAEVNDGRGGWTKTPSSPYSDIPCTFVPYSTGHREIVIAGRPKGMADGDIWLPLLFEGAPLEVREADKIIIAELDGDPERTFDVIFPAPHQGILIQAAVRLSGA